MSWIGFLLFDDLFDFLMRRDEKRCKNRRENMLFTFFERFLGDHMKSMSAKLK